MIYDIRKDPGSAFIELESDGGLVFNLNICSAAESYRLLPYLGSIACLAKTADVRYTSLAARLKKPKHFAIPK